MTYLMVKTGNFTQINLLTRYLESKNYNHSRQKITSIIMVRINAKTAIIAYDHKTFYSLM